MRRIFDGGVATANLQMELLIPAILERLLEPEVHLAEYSAPRAEADLLQFIADAVQVVALDFEFVVFDCSASSAG